MTQHATGQSPRITNPEFQTFRLNSRGQEKADAIRLAYENLWNEVKEQVGTGGGPLLTIAARNVEKACMFSVKAVSVQPQNQE